MKPSPPPPNAAPTVGDLLAAFLEQAGVTTAFGVLSVHNMPLLDALGRRDSVRYVCARGEAGAVNMADAHARVTGGPGVAFTSTGAGAGNACGGIATSSEVAFVALKVTGALVLIWLGIQSLRRAGATEVVLERRGRPFRDGLLTSLANPKLAVFFVALFPQFVGERGDVLATTLAMAAMIVCFDFVWYTTLAVLASRAKAELMRSRAGRWLERVTGSVLIALGLRVALGAR